MAYRRKFIKKYIQKKKWKEIHIVSHGNCTGPTGINRFNYKYIFKCVKAKKIRFYGCETGGCNGSNRAKDAKTFLSNNYNKNHNVEVCGSPTYTQFYTKKGQYGSSTGWIIATNIVWPRDKNKTVYLESDQYQSPNCY